MDLVDGNGRGHRWGMTPTTRAAFKVVVRGYRTLTLTLTLTLTRTLTLTLTLTLPLALALTVTLTPT